MEIILILLIILQSVSIALGVGSSTIAIANFFVAIADGSISTEERRIMQVVYVTIRVGMALILISTLFIAFISISSNGFSDYFTSFKLAVWSLIFMLFINALAMTKHWVSSTFGPAIQAASWYTLSVITALLPLNLHNFTYSQFLLGYAAAMTLSVSVVNLLIMYLNERREVRAE